MQDKQEYFVLLKHDEHISSAILDLPRPYRAYSLPNTAAFFVRARLILMFAFGSAQQELLPCGSTGTVELSTVTNLIQSCRD
mgnify:CR=1 FL=1